MVDRNVPDPFLTIADALAAPGDFDRIVLADHYGPEDVTITISDITITGPATATGINLFFADGVTNFVLAGEAPINVTDTPEGTTNSTGNNNISGNDGDNIITVTGGTDVVDGGGGLGIDRLVVDYSWATTAITGTASSSSGAGSSVAYSDFESFKVLGGTAADTITLTSGDNIIDVGGGADGVTVGDGDNYIDAGDGANIVTAGNGNNIINSGDAADSISVGTGDNRIFGGNGANIITAGTGNNLISTGDAADTITASGGNNVIEAGLGANIITTGAGNDIIESANAADTVDTGAGNDIIKDTGGAGAVTAGAGHDRLIMDYSESITAVTNTLTGAAPSYGGVIAATTFSGVEEFHITGSGIDDNILTGAGSDVLDGGAGADTLNAGEGSDVIYAGDGDVVNGGEDANGKDFDVLVLNDFGDYRIDYTTVDDVVDTESGTVVQLVDGNETGASVDFTGIESIEFANNIVTTPEDTKLSGDLPLASGTTVTSFEVDNINYSAGDRVSRTEGDLQINEDGSYTFIPAPNYNGPAPVINYTDSEGVVSSLRINVTPVEDTGAPICFVQGTMIATADGEVLIEDLEVGDLIQTVDHGLQPLCWIGSRHLDASVLAKNANMRPIRIRKDVLRSRGGVRDLVVSPQHRILVASPVAQKMFGNTEVLVAAKQLLEINGVEIAYDLEEVTYFHILFDEHQLVLADGVPAESLYLGPQTQRSLSSAGWEEILTLLPEISSPSFMLTSCRPIIQNKLARKLALRHSKNNKPLLCATSADG